MTTDTRPPPTDDEIAALRSEFGITSNGRGIKEFTQVRDFARSVDSEVRKQDEALILMLVERLERADKISGYANNREAIKAGRARLESKP